MISDQGQDNEIQSNSPDSYTTQQDEWQIPDNINLDSSGLRCSTGSAVLGRPNKVYSHSTTSLKTQVKRSSTKACLVLFSSFCAIGAGLTCWVHSHQVLAQSSSKLTHAIESYHRVNLYDGTINCFSTLAQSSMALNEMFNYKQVLHKPDYHEFVKSMVNKVDDHESRVHWTLTKRCDFLPGTKTI